MSGDDRAHGYFPMTTALGKVYTPRDMYYGTLLSSAEALHSGITTVHNWCHNVMSHEHAVEDLRAMQETGLRGRFSYGPARSTPSPSRSTWPTSRACMATGPACRTKAC